MGLLTDREKGLLNHDSIEEARKGKIVYIDLDEICMNPDNIGVMLKMQRTDEINPIAYL